MSRPVLMAVDDDGPVLAAVERDLRDRYAEHYQVITASSGDQALDLLRRLRLREDTVALLLVDQRMPGHERHGVPRRLPRALPRRASACCSPPTPTPTPRSGRSTTPTSTTTCSSRGTRRTSGSTRCSTTCSRPGGGPRRRRTCGWSATAGRPSSHALREFLARNLVPYRWLDVETDPQARVLLDAAGADAGALPVLVTDDGEVLVAPDLHTVAERIGLQVRAERSAYDLVVAGAGPAGLAAGVYGASEGLSTLVLECNAPGGQAGTTSRIENYLGFPVGLSGADLTLRAREQAIRFGAEILVPGRGGRAAPGGPVHGDPARRRHRGQRLDAAHRLRASTTARSTCRAPPRSPAWASTTAPAGPRASTTPAAGSSSSAAATPPGAC